MDDTDVEEVEAPAPPPPRGSVVSLATAGEEAPKPTNLERELGVPFALPFSVSSMISDHQLLRTGDVTVSQLVEMRRRDGQARALYRLMVLPIRAALQNAVWEPADGDAGEAEFIEQMFTLPPQAGGMTVTFHRFVAQALLAIFDGFAPFEQVYWMPTKGPLAGKYTMKKLAYRPSETIFFEVDDHGGFDGFRQRTVFQGRAVDVKIKREDSFYYAANEEENPFYGVSYFNAAFYHYDKKVKLYYLAHLAAQIRAVGGRFGKYPPSATARDKQAFKRALEMFGAGTSITAPDGFTVEDLAKGLTVFPWIEAIEHHNNQMSKSVLAPFFDALAVAATTNVSAEFMFEIEKRMAEEFGLEIDYDSIEARMLAEAEAEAAVKQATQEATIATAKVTAADPKGAQAAGGPPGNGGGKPPAKPAAPPKPGDKPVKATHPILTLSQLAQEVLEEIREEDALVPAPA